MRTAPINAVLRLSIGMVPSIFFSAYLRGFKIGKNANLREFLGKLREDSHYTREEKKIFRPFAIASKWRTPKTQSPHTQALSKTLRGLFWPRQWLKAVACSALGGIVAIAMRRVGGYFAPLSLKNRQPATFL